MKALPAASPVLSCQQTLELEASILQDEAAEWAAMQQAGRGIAKAIQLDFQELSPLSQAHRVLALIGKGNNGGDALIACSQLLADLPHVRVTLIFAQDPEAMKPLAKRAYAELEGRVCVHQLDIASDEADSSAVGRRFGGCWLCDLYGWPVGCGHSAAGARTAAYLDWCG